MQYVQGFVAAVPTANRELYPKHVEDAAAVIQETAHLNLVACRGTGGPDRSLAN